MKIAGKNLIQENRENNKQKYKGQDAYKILSDGKYWSSLTFYLDHWQETFRI